MSFKGFTLKSQDKVPVEKRVAGVVITEDVSGYAGHIIDEDGNIHAVSFSSMKLMKNFDISEKLNQVISFLSR